MSEIREGIKIVGHVELFNPETNEILHSSNNMIVIEGKNLIASRLAGIASGFAGGVAVGDSNSSTTQSMTRLVSQVGTKIELYSTSVSGNELTYTANFLQNSPSLSVFSVKEVGLFNGTLPSSTMIARIAIPGSGITKYTNETLAVRWKIRID